jgi:general stress protein YciG
VTAADREGRGDVDVQTGSDEMAQGSKDGDTSNRGFASMDPEKRREIDSKGGQASGGDFANDPERAAQATKGAVSRAAQAAKGTADAECRRGRCAGRGVRRRDVCRGGRCAGRAVRRRDVCRGDRCAGRGVRRRDVCRGGAPGPAGAVPTGSPPDAGPDRVARPRRVLARDRRHDNRRNDPVRRTSPRPGDRAPGDRTCAAAGGERRAPPQVARGAPRRGPRGVLQNT